MKYLIDTNVISELVAVKPNIKVIKWFSSIPMDALFLSVLTFGEIRKGIEKISEGKKKQKLLIWLEHELTHQFSSRILEINLEVADRWGKLLNQSKRTLNAIDSLFAATALHYDMALVTRNTADFLPCPNLEIINPWNT